MKPAVEDDPCTRWTTLIGPENESFGLRARMSAWSHDVISRLKIRARRHPVRSSGEEVGTEWNTPIPPRANGTCTIWRPLATSESYLDFVIGISPEPKSLRDL